MGYLRGTKPRSSYGSIPPSRPIINSRSIPLANKVRRLEYLLNKQKPELQQYRANFSHTPSVVGVNEKDHDVTLEFVGDPSFRDRVLGDCWYNKKLVLKFFPLDNGSTTLRMIVYIPEKPSSVWSPATNYQFTQMPDHTAFKVLHDKTYTKTHSTTRLNGTVSVNLGNLLTKYNSDASTVDSGAIKIKFFWYSTTSNPMYFSTNLYYTNK